jgi:hypothetical protein
MIKDYSFEKKTKKLFFTHLCSSAKKAVTISSAGVGEHRKIQLKEENVSCCILEIFLILTYSFFLSAGPSSDDRNVSKIKHFILYLHR